MIVKGKKKTSNEAAATLYRGGILGKKTFVSLPTTDADGEYDVDVAVAVVTEQSALIQTVHWDGGDETSSDCSADAVPNPFRSPEVVVVVANVAAVVDVGWPGERQRRYLLADGKWADRYDCLAPAIVYVVPDCGVVNVAAVEHRFVGFVEGLGHQVARHFELSVVVVGVVRTRLVVVAVTCGVVQQALGHPPLSLLLSSLDKRPWDLNFSP